MAGPGPLDGSVESTNFGQTSGNYVVLNELVLLLDAASAADEGHWVAYTPMKVGTLEITTSGSPTFSVTLSGSNAATKPTDATAGTAIGSAITAAGFVAVTLAPRWIKANLTAITGGGSVTAALNAFSP